MRLPVRTLKAIILLASICGASAACGIDTFATLVNDPIPKSSSVSGLELLGPEDDTEDSYLGIEIFYRIYAVMADAETDRGYVVSKQSATNAVPGSIVESYLATTSGLSYHKPVLRDIMGYQQIRIPAIKKDDLVTNDYYVVVSFPSSGTEPTITINNNNADTDDDETYTFRRSAVDSGGAFLTFLDEPGTSHSDFRSNALDDIENEYYVQFFAASYGIDFANFSELYGDAVYIGTIVMNF